MERFQVSLGISRDFWIFPLWKGLVYQVTRFRTPLGGGSSIGQTPTALLLRCLAIHHGAWSQLQFGMDVDFGMVHYQSLLITV